MRNVLRPRRLVVVFVQYDTQKYPDAFKRMRLYLRKYKVDMLTYVVVDNKSNSPGWYRGDGRTFFLPGDNTDREFSAWRKGVEFVKAQGVVFDVILFANDAFEAGSRSYLRNHDARWLTVKSHMLNAVVGTISTNYKDTRLLGMSARHWIKTNCFFVPKSVMDQIGDLVSIDESALGDYLPEAYPESGELFKSHAPINDVYKDYLVDWLTNRWHSKMKIHDGTWVAFRGKVKSIFNEALFSARVREKGHMILPYSVPGFFVGRIRAFLGRKKNQVRDSLARVFENGSTAN